MSYAFTTPVYTCEFCQKTYGAKQSLIRHLRNCTISKQQFQCQACFVTFTRKDNLKRHMKTSHKKEKLSCQTCKSSFPNCEVYEKHISSCKPATVSQIQKCDTCSRCFSSLENLNKHMRAVHVSQQDKATGVSQIQKCDTCSRCFSSLENLNKHKLKTCLVSQQDKASIASQQDTASVASQMHKCNSCSRCFTTKKNVNKHIKTVHVSQQGAGKLGKQRTSQQGVKRSKPKGVSKRAKKRKIEGSEQRSSTLQASVEAPQGCVVKGALAGNVKEFHFFPEGQEGLDPMFYLVKIQPQVIQSLKTEIESKHSIKWGLCTQFKFSKSSSDGETFYVEPYFRTRMQVGTAGDDLELLYTDAIRKILKDMDTYEGESSSLNFEEVLNVKVSIVKFKPFAGSSYLPLPNTLHKKKRSLLNIQNIHDDLCFVYSILAHLYPVSSEHVREQVCHYKPHLQDLNLDGCQFPMKLKQISKFEKANNLSVNVYGYSEESEMDDKENIVFPLRISDNIAEVPKERHIDLLLITSEVEEEDEGALSHYVLINNLNQLLWKKGRHHKSICRKCLWGFISEEALDKHKPYCFHKAQRIRMPEPDQAQRKFGLGQCSKMVRVPFCVYLDFESVLQPVDETQKRLFGGKISPIHHHVACGYSYQIVCREPDLYSFPLKTYSGENASEHLMENLLEDYTNIMEILDDPVPMQLTPDVTERLSNTTVCHICDREIGECEQSHIDHDHLTGKVRGLTHSECNVNYKESKFLPVICHNMSRYDSKLILQAAELFSDRNINCIPHNTENFLMFEIDRMRFLDSYKFLDASLDTLSKNLRKKGLDEFHYLSQRFPDHVDMLSRKLPYFYEFVNHMQVLNVTEFPSRDAFYSSLTEETVTEADYEYARKIWDTFEIETVREFMELYVSVDTLILTDVMEAFRNMCLQFYKLDPYNFYSLPGLSNDACLKMTGVTLDLFTDPDMYNFVEQGIRGGVASINHRYAEANNRYMKDEFDPMKPESYLVYFDINNLYGKAMVCPLPRGDFKWVETEQIDQIDWAGLDPEGDIGYIVECDIEYCRDLHFSHRSFPVAPVKESIPFEEFSQYHREMLEKFGLLGKKGKNRPSSGTKLFATLKDKQHYTIYSSTLQFYLKLGLKLKKIHKVLQFTQSRWMESYVNFNTMKRKEATDDFSKSLFKLMINANYGKQLQNVRNYQQVELITSKERLRRFTSKTNFKHVNIFSEHLVAVSLDRVSTFLNQPVSIGFTVLEHAKRILYEFHYNVMMREYESTHLKVLMSDTDSIFYQMTAPLGVSLRDPYDVIRDNLSLFDTSNYPESHPLYSMERHKTIGVMKDELPAKVIREFVGLRAKNYSFTFDETPGDRAGEKLTAKGVQKNYVKKHLRHKMFKECLFDLKKTMASYHQIRSSHNQLYTIKVVKLALNPLDDRRYLLDQVESRPYGYNPL